MATRKLTLAKPETIEVVLSDPGSDLDRKYRVVLFTRSVKQRLRELGDEVAAESEKDKPDDEKVLRLICDQINLMLSKEKEETPEPGDLLFEGWEQERVTDDQIIELYGGLVDASTDPT